MGQFVPIRRPQASLVGTATAECLHQSTIVIPPMSIVSLSRQGRSAAAEGLRVALEPGFDFCSPEYRSLHRRSRATAFQGPDWLAGLRRQVAPAFAAGPLTVAGRSNDAERVVLVRPL